MTCKLPLLTVDAKRPGRPAYPIPKEVLVELRGLNFSWCKISDMFGVSRWTVMRRVQEYGISDFRNFPTFQMRELTILLKTTSHAMVVPLVSRSCQAIFILLVCMWRDTELGRV